MNEPQTPSRVSPSSSRLARGALLLALVAAAGCASIPDPGGVRAERGRIRVRTDGQDADFARACAELTEEYLAELTPRFGLVPDDLGEVTVLVCRTEEGFAAALGQYRPAMPASAIDGFTVDGFACVRWGSERRGRRALVHELVHVLVDRALPDLPPFWNEGLAYELTHTLQANRETPAPGGRGDGTARFVGAHPAELDGCGLPWAVGRTPEDLAAALRRCEEGEALDAPSSRLAAALVRFGIETGGWQDLRELEDWEPDLTRFAAWLRQPEGWRALHSRMDPVEWRLGRHALVRRTAAR